MAMVNLMRIITVMRLTRAIITINITITEVKAKIVAPKSSDPIIHITLKAQPICINPLITK